MKLSNFINNHMEEILVEWEAFARMQTPAATSMSEAALRGNGKPMLKAIALNIETDQSPDEQYEKSRGMAENADDYQTAASKHGMLRLQSGFTLLQLTGEFRALRASVLRLWLPYIVQASTEASDDMIRFNETIDQALAESVVAYSEQIARNKDTFIAILGHDLRSPLLAMAMAGEALTRMPMDKERTLQIGMRVKRSTAMMSTMVNDLLEYARTQLGGEIPLSPSPNDMGDICQSALEDARAAHPDSRFELHVSGDLSGMFDSARLYQVFANLLNNAVQYGDPEYSIDITAKGEPDAVVVKVRNYGAAIPLNSLHSIFDPLSQLYVEGRESGQPTTSLGLGLFIARTITQAHGGTIRAESNKNTGTIFTLRFPRLLTAQVAGADSLPARNHHIL